MRSSSSRDRGRLWARDLLAALRADRFRPRAWLRFLGRSFERAAVIRAERPLEHRTAVSLAAAGLSASWAYSDARMLRNPFMASCEETGESMSDLVEGELEGWRR